MPLPRYDIGSKWLLHTQGKGALLVGGLEDVRRCQAMPGELVQTRTYPDGLLQVFLGSETKPHHVLVEVATYPEKRALKQALDDLTLAYQALGHLPKLLMLVLHPKGKFRIGGTHEVRSKLGLSRLAVEWKVVEVWTLLAEEYLARRDPGATPWITLMRFDGPPEALLQRCAEKIEREAHPEDRADLLAVAQVLAGLRFPAPELLNLFGGQKPMIESPVLQKLIAERWHTAIQEFLGGRFGPVPPDVTRLLRDIMDERKLTKLSRIAGKYPNLEAFREALLS